MGDIIHALPAVASLHQSFPNHHITWALARKWVPLMEGNPHINQILPFDRHGKNALLKSWLTLRSIQPAITIDFQGLIQSALVGRASRPHRFIGLDRSQAREPLAAFLYTQSVKTKGPHRVETNLELAAAAGATQLTDQAWIPPGSPERRITEWSIRFHQPVRRLGQQAMAIRKLRTQLSQEPKAEGLPLVGGEHPAKRAREVGGDAPPEKSTSPVCPV